ncbi:MAG TPA: S53 family peptidase [Gemmataceae bacterium]|nr:S53 family peptidase [Gemmataceae bacterium]
MAHTFKLRHYHTRTRRPRQRRLNRRAAGGALTPVQCAIAYQFPAYPGLQTVPMGIVSLGGTYSTSEVATEYQRYAIPAPTISLLSVDGNVATSDPGGANVENALDIACQGVTSQSTGLPQRIIFLSATNSDTGFADAITAGVKAGCKIISISWGQARSQWTASGIAAMEAALAYAQSNNVWVFVASGDNALDDGTGSPVPDYPAASAYSWGCGGTRLVLNSANAIASEAAWGDGKSADEGGGGGIDTTQPVPPWQVGIVKGGRGVPDSAANADPNSGYPIYCDGAWETVGGTSGAAPLTAAFFCLLYSKLLAMGITPPADPHAALYAFPEAFHDITTGSNGTPSVVGWDEDAGLGSPDGALAMNAFTNSTPMPIPTPVPTPTPQPPTPVPTPTPQPPPPTPTPAPPAGKVFSSQRQIFVQGGSWEMAVESLGQLHPGAGGGPHSVTIGGNIVREQVGQHEVVMFGQGLKLLAHS